MDSTKMTLKMLVDGASVGAREGGWIDVENPGNKTVFAQVPRGTAADVDQAVTAAKKAFVGWSRTSPAERSVALFAIADLLEKRHEEIARLVASENGNALRTQSRGEITRVVEIFRYLGGLSRELKGQSSYVSATTLDYTRREPYGVVGAIVPWNSPVSLAAQKIAPAICTGNTIVLKASEVAPLGVLMLGQACAEVLPPGVVNVITGYGAECGAPLAAHHDVRKVSFTGSTAVGRSILVAASERIASVSLELGGKSAQIVFPDVDQDTVAEGIITAMRFTRQGQSCTAGSRLLVHADIADSLLAALTDRLKRLRVGDPLDESTDIGSIVNQRQFDRVCNYISQAEGQSPDCLILGGKPPTTGPLTKGYFVEPTVFFNLPKTTPMTHEEVFGPVLSVETWHDEDDVIARANDSEYGLAGYVWCKAGAPALRVAHALEAGWVMVNQGGGQALGHSYGGVKQSGLGRELSLEGMLESFTQHKQVSVNLG
jgi:acyl-CoA reductase-like NAD-dependent aldehyde dehydrogenase